jgi:hypothetical protein
LYYPKLRLDTSQLGAGSVRAALQLAPFQLGSGWLVLPSSWKNGLGPSFAQARCSSVWLASQAGIGRCHVGPTSPAAAVVARSVVLDRDGTPARTSSLPDSQRGAEPRRAAVRCRRLQRRGRERRRRRRPGGGCLDGELK